MRASWTRPNLEKGGVRGPRADVSARTDPAHVQKTPQDSLPSNPVTLDTNTNLTDNNTKNLHQETSSQPNLISQTRPPPPHGTDGTTSGVSHLEVIDSRYPVLLAHVVSRPTSRPDRLEEGLGRWENVDGRVSEKESLA
jgi:hypothetical protein